MAEYANRQSGQVESLVRVCGFDSHLGYYLIPWSSGEDSWSTSRQRWFESIRDHSLVRSQWSVVSSPEEFWLSATDYGLLTNQGCCSNMTTPAPHAGNEGASPSRSTQNSGDRKAVIRQPW